MYPHYIRLRGPWVCEPFGENAPPKTRMSIPCRWDEGGLKGFIGKVRFRRRFGKPRRLDPHERVWLKMEGISGHGRVLLNETSIGEVSTTESEWDVTPLIGDRNELVVEIESTTSPGGITGEVALEIRTTAYMRGVKFQALTDGRWQVHGEVVGSFEQPMELYLIVGRRTAAYKQLPVSGRFELTADESAADSTAEVRLDLVAGASVLYAVMARPQT